MQLIGSGMLSSVLHAYVFFIAALLINMVIGFNFKKEILSGCKCAYGRSKQDMLWTTILLLFLSMGVVIITADIAFSISSLLFFDEPNVEKKIHLINLTTKLAITFSSVIFKSIVTFINRNGQRLISRFLQLEVNKEEQKSKEHQANNS